MQQRIKRILILGNGGREHVLSEAYAKNKHVTDVFVLPGNGLIGVGSKKVTALTREKADFANVLKVCKKQKIDLVDVAQDSFLADGFVDKLKDAGILAFGPTKAASEIEWSKSFSRQFMETYKLPIPRFASFSDPKKAMAYLKKLPDQPLFIKASGLALGKGAIRADTKKEAVLAIEEMKKFGEAGQTFLIEECMKGEEFSFFVICDGEHFVTIGYAQDHKTVCNKNLGPNTGGMGCVAPCGVVTKKIREEVEKKIIAPFLKGMLKEGRPYVGILYAGCMLTAKGIKIVEFNARLGDPEAEVLIPSIQTDYLTLLTAVLTKRLEDVNVTFDGKFRVSVAGCAFGYPEDYGSVKGKEVKGLEEMVRLKGVSVFGSGITRKGKKFLVNGGRVFHAVGAGNTFIEARQKAYEAMGTAYIEGNNLQYRTDIGWRDMERRL